MINKKYLILFSSCLLSKGASQAIVFDMQRNDVKIVPDTLINIIEDAKNIDLEELYSKYADSKNVLDQYINFLLSEEICFIGNEDEKKRFTKLSLNWDETSVITNAIIDINKTSKYDVFKAIKMLDELNCLHIQIRIYGIIDFKSITKLLENIENTSIRSFELICDHNNFDDKNLILELPETYSRISNLVVYNSPHQEIGDIQNRKSYTISFYSKDIEDESHCGNISPVFFCKNPNHYFESQKHNTCLNRKVGIDVNGEIKNCPSMSKSFGNICDSSISKAVTTPDFKNLWFIHKDQIEVCKDCEFRHICTDCRAFVKKTKNKYSQPAKCNYNPYIAKWKGEKGYITVEEYKLNIKQ